MKIYVDYEFNDLCNCCDNYARQTLNKIEEEEKETELMNLLNDCFIDDIPHFNEINDFLAFDSEWIFETLGIKTK